MSLYDDLDSKDSKSDIAGWSSGFKLLQSQLQAKKASLLQTKRQRQTTTLAPVVDLKRNTPEELHFNQITGKLEPIGRSSSPNVASPFLAMEPQSRFIGVNDEYNPLYPNEYDDFVKKRKEQRQREREEDRRNRNRERDEERRNRRRKDKRKDSDDEGEFDKRRRMREDEEDDYEKPRRGAGAAIAPPSSLLEDSDQGMNAVPPPQDNDNQSQPVGGGGGGGGGLGLSGSIASKIMARYGYREGQGLGKKEQGMSTALMVEKTSKRGGKIIHEKDVAKYAVEFMDPFKMPSLDPTPQMRGTVTTTDLLKNPSKVIILRNMVAPGEVDDDLEPETAEECSKYGKVVKCVIFEMQNVTEDEAVRIFVEFERQESAIKAVVDINGRYFGGRVVKGGFYNIDKFRRLDLAGEV